MKPILLDKKMHLFLDFDGTLIDSSQGIYYSFAKACRAIGLIPPDFLEFRSLIGPPIEKISKTLFHTLDDETTEQLRQHFRADYDQERYRMFTWHERVEETLALLARDCKLPLSIVTNKPTQPTLDIIEEAGLRPFFQHVVGIDYPCKQSVGTTFPSKANAITFALELTDCHPSACFYVGDTPSDLEAAHKSQVTFIAATYGFYQWENDDLNGRASLTSFSGLPQLLVDLGALDLSVANFG